MKIIHLCLSSFYIEGFGYQENIIPKYNRKDGHEVTIIASRFTFNKRNGQEDEAETGEYINQDGIKVIRVDFKYPRLGKLNKKLKIYKNTYKLIEREKPDLIFCHGIQFLDLKVVVKYLKDFPKCRLVADSHAAYINSGRTFLSRIILHKVIYKYSIKRSLNFISKLYVIAPGCRDFAKDMYHIPDKKMENLFLGADVDMINLEKKEEIRFGIRREFHIDDDDFLMISGGKLTREKNIKQLIDVMKNINISKIKLIIFGVFSDEIKVEILNKISTDKRIKYIGWIDSEKIYDYYLASDLAVFPGTKSALWEQAICCGLPLICRRWPGMEYVDVGGNVIFLDDDNEDSIKYEIEKLFNNQELYEKMGKIAATKGYEIFSYEKISKQAIS